MAHVGEKPGEGCTPLSKDDPNKPAKRLGADDCSRISDDSAAFSETKVGITAARNSPLGSAQRVAERVKVNSCIRWKTRSGRPRSRRTVADIDKVREMIGVNPEDYASSASIIAMGPKTSHGGARRILRGGRAA